MLLCKIEEDGLSPFEAARSLGIDLLLSYCEEGRTLLLYPSLAAAGETLGSVRAHPYTLLITNYSPNERAFAEKLNLDELLDGEEASSLPTSYFSSLWREHKDEIVARLNDLNKGSFVEMSDASRLIDRLKGASKKDRMAALRRKVFMRSARGGGQFYMIRDLEGFAQQAGWSSKEDLDPEGYLTPYLGEPLDDATCARLCFEWVKKQFGLDQNRALFLDDKQIWPLPDGASYAEFESSFLSIIPRRGACFFASPLAAIPSDRLFLRVAPLRCFDTFYNLPISTTLFSLPFLEESFIDSEDNFSLARSLSEAVTLLLPRYYSYLSIPDRALTRPYGEKLDLTLECLSSSSMAEVHAFMLSLNPHPRLAEKLIQLFTEAVLEQLDEERRDHALKRGALCLPHLRTPNPLSSLAKAYGLGLAGPIIQEMISCAETPQELFAMASLATVREVVELMNSHSLGGVALLIYSSLQRVATPRDLQNMLLGSVNLSPEEAIDAFLPAFKAHALEALCGSPIDRSFIATSACFLTPSFARELDDTEPFTAIQLINRHFAVDGQLQEALQGRDLETARALITKSSKLATIQIINQSAQHGSERGAIETVLIESLQNSTDAIIGAHNSSYGASIERHQTDTLGTVSFKVERLKREDGREQLIIEVSDPIGMESFETLLTDFLLPGFSRKSQEEGAVGRLGSGIFQTYGAASCVTVMTRPRLGSGAVYLLRIKPKRDSESGEVVDLALRCARIEPAAFVGTQIRFLFQPGEADKVERDARFALDYLRRVIGCSLRQLPGGDEIRLELLREGGEPEPLRAIDARLPIQIGGRASSFEAFTLKDRLAPGVVLTGGVPFNSLSNFLVEEGILSPTLATACTRGWALQLPLGSYEPSQSRLKLKLHPAARRELALFVAEVLYLSPL